eukprot:CAMPEP_0181114562 /NCGR_PEP_ID=MMETSP1071-20121207/20961_1 /TAXON_ID=35127 /ORGANISM="Thalassiosira sp., Strain NH16" /LENGTH=999 /DNA_ID=CAMNT_0023198703 /DNA_START=126 /DNA_END=3126 /DNA_ORIENTATION=-
MTSAIIMLVLSILVIRQCPMADCFPIPRSSRIVQLVGNSLSTSSSSSHYVPIMSKAAANGDTMEGGKIIDNDDNDGIGGNYTAGGGDGDIGNKNIMIGRGRRKHQLSWANTPSYDRRPITQQQQGTNDAIKRTPINSSSSSRRTTTLRTQSREDEEGQVHGWLLQSTSSILGDEVTLNLINNDHERYESYIVTDDAADAEDDDDCNCGKISTVSSFARTDEEYILHAESVMRAYGQWIARHGKSSSSSSSSSPRLNDDDAFDNDDDNCGDDDSYCGTTLRCSAINAAKIVDMILTRSLEVIDGNRQRIIRGYNTSDDDDGDCDGVKGGSTITTTTGGSARVVDWDAKLIELINVAIDAWATGKNVEGAERRFLLLQQQILPPLMQRVKGDEGSSGSGQQQQQRQHVLLKLYEESYRGVIRACIRSRERKYLTRAIELLEDMQQRGGRIIGLARCPIIITTQTYNLVLYGLANCDPCVENARRAESILDEMTTSIMEHCRPNEGAVVAGRCYPEGDTTIGPDSNTFRQVITAWTKSCHRSGNNNDVAIAAAKARRILDRMLSDFPSLYPDASTFNAIMTIYLKLGKTDEALAVFDLMNTLHASGRGGDSGNTAVPDTYSFNLMLRAIQIHAHRSREENIEAVEELIETSRERYQVRPDVNSYNILIDAYAKSRLEDAANRAEVLLGYMEGDVDTIGRSPPMGIATRVPSMPSNDRGITKRGWAEGVFRRMEGLHSEGLVEAPTTPVYNALMNCLITSEERGSVERAEALFSETAEAGLANTRTYNTMMKGYSMFRRSRIDGSIIAYSRPRKAEKLLDEMELSYYSKGLASPIIPDKYSYTTVISAYGRSNATRKAAKSLMILHRMLESYGEGNSAARAGTYAFNAVLNACAHTRHPDERLEAFTILCSTLILLKDWAKPDHTTYGTFLQACARLLPRDEARKWRVVEAVFDSCTKEGQCGDLVLKELKGVASPELYEALVGRFLTEDGLDIPLQWRRNVA